MKQEQAIEKLKSGSNVFLTGEPGAGKTYTINRFTEWLDSEDIIYAVTASTGIAASHIDGSTIHSWSGIGILSGLEESDVDSIRFNTFNYKRIKPARVLILDEVSMLGATFIDDLDKVLKKIHQSEAPFGGIQVVMVGDFFQLPPVSREGETRFAFESDAWTQADLDVCYLTEQHRQAEPLFTNILKAMRFGTMAQEQKNVLMSRLSTHQTQTKLYTHNVDVDRENNQKLDSIKEKPAKFFMTSFGDDYSVKTLKRNCLSPEVLVLKKGAVVMFTANNPNKGYVNGTTGVVESCDDDTIRIKTVDGRIVYPEKHVWKAYNEKNEEKARISQIPLKLAWAVTVHKSQGMSLDEATIDLSRAFEYGHGYVAISRVRSLNGLHLAGINEDAFKVNPKVLEQDLIFRASGS